MISFKTAGPEHCELYYEWANDPAVRKNSFNTGPIPYESHKKWFTEKLNSKDVFLLIFFKDKVPLGQVRLEKENKLAFINFSIDHVFRGKGYAPQLLALASEFFFKDSTHEEVIGFVKFNNVASQKTFIKAGFKRKENSDNISFSLRKS